MLQRVRPGVPSAINFSKGMVTRGSPSLIPSRFVKRLVSVLFTALISEAQAQVVIGFAIVRVRVASRQSFDGFSKVCFGFCELTAAKMPQPQRIVAAGIERIAAQYFAPVRHGRT